MDQVALDHAVDFALNRATHLPEDVRAGLQATVGQKVEELTDGVKNGQHRQLHTDP